MSSKSEPVIDFAKYTDLRVRVRFQGGREVDGVLKGYDKLDNLVLDSAVEYLRGPLFIIRLTECVDHLILHMSLQTLPIRRK